jgi:ectoine hydroxylase-related dioxygenase (phytanoyl-CoA dioxygenase family)
VTTLRELIQATGRAPISRVTWSDDELFELRSSGSHLLRRAARRRRAQFDLHHSWPELLDLVTDSAIVADLEELFGTDSFQLVETRVFPKPPHSPAHWHIDIAQLLAYRPSLLDTSSAVLHSVTTWLALEDVPLEMGALKMLHHTHIDLNRLVRAKKEGSERDYYELCAAEARKRRREVEVFAMKAGEYCIFDPRNLHTGATNCTDQYRHAVVMRYCAQHVDVKSKFSKRGRLRILTMKSGKPVREGDADHSLAARRGAMASTAAPLLPHRRGQMAG